MLRFTHALASSVRPRANTGLLTTLIRRNSTLVEVQSQRSRASKLLIAGAAAAGILGVGMYGAMITDDVGTSSQDKPVWSPAVRARLQSTYSYLGGGLAITAGAAVAALRSPTLLRAVNSPILLAGGSIATLIALMVTPPQRKELKAGLFLTFSGLTGLSLAPLSLLGGPVVMKAALYTAGIVGSLSFVAANSPSHEFLYLGGPLAMGLGAVFIASLGSIFIPATSLAGAALANVSMYGGLALFSGFVLYDTSKVITHAETKSDEAYDPINECLGIYLDAINIFVRLAQLFGNQKRK